MKVHHLNCGTMCALAGRLVSGRGRLRDRAPLVCHCLLVEGPRGLVLVDSGLGLTDVRRARRGLDDRMMALLAKPAFLEEETALRQIERLGFHGRDVRDVVLTHLDLDHAGSLPDFPDARVHVTRAEHAAALSPRTPVEAGRYRQDLWAHGPRWVRHDAEGERWLGFDAVRPLDDGEPDLLMIPLAGHTRGHAGVAVRTTDGWLLHAGDAYFFHGEVDPRAPWCPPALRVMQTVLETDRRARLANQARLRALIDAHGDDVTVFSAHDATEHAQALEAPPASAYARPEAATAT